MKTGHTRRFVTGVAAAGVVLAAVLAVRRGVSRAIPPFDELALRPPPSESAAPATGAPMPVRELGRTGLKISEVGFGAWGIGGQAYGSVNPSAALEALSRAEDLGCNFVDTAPVYGDSEELLGKFLRGRRSRWVVATKYSKRDKSMSASLEAQLKRLRMDGVDLYQIHWAPGREEEALYAELDAIKRSGKARYVGVSLRSASDVDYVLDNASVDTIQLRLSLLDPDPFLQKLGRIRTAGIGVIARSALREGFLTGKYSAETRFEDARDQRHTWSRREISDVVEAVDSFRFLERNSGSLLRAAVSYPLSFPEVSTVILGTKSRSQADSNFGDLPGRRLDIANLERVYSVQIDQRLLNWRDRLRDIVRPLVRP